MIADLKQSIQILTLNNGDIYKGDLNGRQKHGFGAY
jgi:hypothetical protein